MLNNATCVVVSITTFFFLKTIALEPACHFKEGYVDK